MCAHTYTEIHVYVWLARLNHTHLTPAPHANFSPPSPSPRFSSGGTKSVLHTDSYENLHCLVSGKKEFVMIEPHYSKTVGEEHQNQGFYNIDVDR